MKHRVRLTESEIHNIINASVKKILKEDFDGYDNDLQYDSIYDQAYQYIIRNVPGVMSWREIAEGIGFRMDTIGPNDMETLKDAIEDAMMDTDEGGIDEDDLITNCGDNNYDI